MNMAITSIEAAAVNVHDLAIEIADEACRVDIECKARHCPSDHPAPVYDVSAAEAEWLTDAEIVEANQRDVERAVRYLDARGLLTRPWSASPHLVSFGHA